LSKLRRNSSSLAALGVLIIGFLIGFAFSTMYVYLMYIQELELYGGLLTEFSGALYQCQKWFTLPSFQAMDPELSQTFQQEGTNIRSPNGRKNITEPSKRMLSHTTEKVWDSVSLVLKKNRRHGLSPFLRPIKVLGSLRLNQLLISSCNMDL
jgi:hypothetical protein